MKLKYCNDVLCPWVNPETRVTVVLECDWFYAKLPSVRNTHFILGQMCLLVYARAASFHLLLTVTVRALSGGLGLQQ